MMGWEMKRKYVSKRVKGQAAQPTMAGTAGTTIGGMWSGVTGVASSVIGAGVDMAGKIAGSALQAHAGLEESVGKTVGGGMQWAGGRTQEFSKGLESGGVPLAPQLGYAGGLLSGAGGAYMGLSKFSADTERGAGSFLAGMPTPDIATVSAPSPTSPTNQGRSSGGRAVIPQLTSWGTKEKTGWVTGENPSVDMAHLPASERMLTVSPAGRIFGGGSTSIKYLSTSMDPAAVAWRARREAEGSPGFADAGYRYIESAKDQASTVRSIMKLPMLETQAIVMGKEPLPPGYGGEGIDIYGGSTPTYYTAGVPVIGGSGGLKFDMSSVGVRKKAQRVRTGRPVRKKEHSGFPSLKFIAPDIEKRPAVRVAEYSTLFSRPGSGAKSQHIHTKHIVPDKKVRKKLASMSVNEVTGHHIDVKRKSIDVTKIGVRGDLDLDILGGFKTTRFPKVSVDGITKKRKK